MEYIYDIVLNFQKTYYDFYEWNRADKIINIKKIPIYKIDVNDYLSDKKNEVTINRDTLTKKNKIFLLTSGVEIMGILIDDNGKVLKKSSLIFEESDDILEDKDEIESINIIYTIDKVNEIELYGRVKSEQKKYIDNYLNNLDKIKDEYLFKYIYYDIFNDEEKNINTIYKKLLELSKNDISKIYTSIKRVDLELKR